MPDLTQITPPRVEIIDPQTGYVSREWYRWFYNLYNATGGNNQGVIPVDRGGTGTGVVPADGQILIGNGTTGTYDVADLSTGDGIGVTTGPGSLEVKNTGVLSIIAGDGITVDHTTGNVTISSNFAADQETQTATANQTVFTLTTMTYTPGSNMLSVFIDGVNQILDEAFTETSSTVVTFSAGLHVGAKVRFAKA